jgi:uncharacterized phage-associated protein
MTATTFDSNAIANYIIRAFQEAGDPITNLKLQKLLYYVQGWYLGINKTPFLEEDFQAWVHGPVLPSVFHRFKAHRWNPINVDVVAPELPKEIISHINDVLEAYGGDTAWALELRTHNESPWINARNGLPADEASNSIITKDSMCNYFKEFIQ